MKTKFTEVIDDHATRIYPTVVWPTRPETIKETQPVAPKFAHRKVKEALKDYVIGGVWMAVGVVVIIVCLIVAGGQ